MENYRLLMRICFNAFVARDVPVVHLMRLLKFHPYIYGGEPPKSMKILCFRTLSMENNRLLMRICFNAFVARDVPMVHSMRLLKFHPYIYIGVNLRNL